MNILAACSGPDSPVTQGRLQVQRALLRLRAGRPGVLHRGDAAARTRRARRSSATSSRPRRPSRDFAERNPRRHRDRAALRQRPRARPAHVAHRAARRCPSCRRSSASTRATSSSTRTTSSACSSTRSATTSPGVYNAAADGVLALSEVAGLLGKPLRAGAAAVGHRPRGRARCAALGRRASRPRCCSSCASAAALDNRKLKATGYRYALHHARDGHQASPSTSGSRRCCGERHGGLPLRARGRGVPALQPERRAPTARRPVDVGPGEPPPGDGQPAAPSRSARRPAGYDDLERRGAHRAAALARAAGLEALRDHERAHAAPAATVLQRDRAGLQRAGNACT